MSLDRSTKSEAHRAVAEPSPREGAPRWRQAGTLVASLLLVAGFGWLLHVGALPVLPATSAFHQVRWWTVFAYAVLWVIVLFLRSARWHWLLAPIHPVPMRRILSVSFIGLAALIVLPFRAGEVVRPAMIRRKGQLSGWAATGTVGAERVVDGLFLSGVLFAALQFSNASAATQRIGGLPVSAALVTKTAYTALLVFAAAFVLMGVFYWRKAFARRTTLRLVGPFSMRLAEALAELISRVADGLAFLPARRYSVPFVLSTALYWALNILAIWLLLWGCGLEELTFSQACVVMGILGLGVLVPNAPGYFGAFQISTYAALALYVSTDQLYVEGAAFVFLLYVLQVGLTIVMGLLALGMERISPAEVLETTAT